MRQSKQRMNLMRAIVIWVFFAVLVLLAVFSLLWYFSPADKDTGLKPLVAIVTASLTTVGGIGAVAYLVMKFRERQDKEKELEQEEANQRRAVVAEADRKLNDAVEQLGSESPQVRLAGVYALADVADNYLAGYKQRVVDILCGYLRTDRSDQLIDGKFKDAAVESAIIKVIGEHLRKDREELEEKVQTLTDEQLWCDCSFDFRGATFTEPVLWEKTLWNKTADFSDSEFSKDLRFRWASFAGDVWFGGARFAGDAGFGGGGRVLPVTQSLVGRVLLVPPGLLGRVLLVPPGSAGRVLLVPLGLVGRVLLVPPGLRGRALPEAPGLRGRVLPVTPGLMGRVLPVTPGLMGRVLPATPGLLGRVLPVTLGLARRVLPATPGLLGRVLPVTSGLMGRVLSISSFRKELSLRTYRRCRNCY